MITGEQIERAERILAITYQTTDIPAQLRAHEVELESFNKWLTFNEERIEKNHRLAYRSSNPQLRAAYRTVMMHAFLVGLVVGRMKEREIV